MSAGSGRRSSDISPQRLLVLTLVAATFGPAWLLLSYAMGAVARPLHLPPLESISYVTAFGSVIVIPAFWIVGLAASGMALRRRAGGWMVIALVIVIVLEMVGSMLWITHLKGD